MNNNIDIYLKEREELCRMDRHFDTVSWTIGGFILPATVAATIYGLKNPDVKDIFIYGSIILLIIWFIIFSRIRLVMKATRDRMREIEKKIGFHNVWDDSEKIFVNKFIDKKLKKNKKMRDSLLEVRNFLFKVHRCVKFAIILLILLNIYFCFSKIEL